MRALGPFATFESPMDAKRQLGTESLRSKIPPLFAVQGGD